MTSDAFQSANLLAIVTDRGREQSDIQTNNMNLEGIRQLETAVSWCLGYSS